MNKNFYKQSGFSLVEIALAVAILAILIGLGMPIFNNFKIKTDLDTARNTVVHNLRRAQGLSQAIQDDDTWGVYVEPGNVVLFKGSSYATRDVDYDDETVILDSFEISGVSEVVFDKLTGLPQSTGDIIITSNTNENRTITVNSKGMVSY